MILISRRKTSPGTSTIREAVNKVTCSRSRPAGSSGRGPRAPTRAAQGSLPPRPGVPDWGQGPCVCFLRVGDLLEGWDCARSLSPSPPFCFLSWTPLTPLRSHPPPFSQSGSSPSPRKAPRLSPPTPHNYSPRPQIWVTFHLFVLACFTRQPGRGWVGNAQQGPLEATCRGYPGVLNNQIPRSRGDPCAH